MKPHFKLLLNVAAVACLGLGSAVAQENLLPVSRTAGVMSVSLPINQVTLMALPLTDIVASGTITSVSGTTLGVSATLGDVTTAPHAVKITSRNDQRGTGPNAPAGTSTNAYGKTAGITSRPTPTTIVTASALAPNVGDEFIIYKLRTIADVFGASGSPVTGWNSGPSPATSDIVYIDNGAGALIGYFHKSGGPGSNGWRLSSAPTGADKQDTPIPAGRAVMVRRRNTGSVADILFKGVATIGRESPIVSTGYSVLNNPFTVPTTLAASTIQDHITTAATAASADHIYLESGGVLTGYFFNSTASQWRLVSGAPGDQGAVVLAAGKSILFKEQAGTAGFALPEPFAE